VVCYSQVSPPKTYIHLFSPPYVLHAPPISFFDLITWISICVYAYHHTVWAKRPCASVGLGHGSQWQSQWLYSNYGYTKYWKWHPLTGDRYRVGTGQRRRILFSISRDPQFEEHEGSYFLYFATHSLRNIKDLIFYTSRPTVWETLRILFPITRDPQFEKNCCDWLEKHCKVGATVYR